MKKLSKEKRNQVVLAVVITMVIVGGLWSVLIRYQKKGLENLALKQTASENKRSRILETINNSNLISAELNVVSNRLALQEQTMCSGDLYSSMISSIRTFKQSYDLDIPQFNSSATETAVSLLPKFPHKQFTVTIAGTGRYHEVGRFIADFENQYPSSRILNLELAPASDQDSSAKEKLSFKMDIVALVKPNATAPVKKAL